MICSWNCCKKFHILLRLLTLNSVGQTAYTGFHSSDNPGCNQGFPNAHILPPSLRTHISWLTSAAAPQRSTIRLPHRLTAKGQTIHVTKDIQVLAPANNSLPFSSERTTGGDKTLPGRSRGHRPWQHNSLFAVVFTAAALAQVSFCWICPCKGKVKWQPKPGGENTGRPPNLGFRQVSYGTVRSQLRRILFSIWAWVTARNTILSFKQLPERITAPKQC